MKIPLKEGRVYHSTHVSPVCSLHLDITVKPWTSNNGSYAALADPGGATGASSIFFQMPYTFTAPWSTKIVDPLCAAWCSCSCQSYHYQVWWIAILPQDRRMPSISMRGIKLDWSARRTKAATKDYRSVLNLKETLPFQHKMPCRGSNQYVDIYWNKTPQHQQRRHMTLSNMKANQSQFPTAFLPQALKQSQRDESVGSVDRNLYSVCHILIHKQRLICQLSRMVNFTLHRVTETHRLSSGQILISKYPSGNKYGETSHWETQAHTSFHKRGRYVIFANPFLCGEQFVLLSSKPSMDSDKDTWELMCSCV